MSATRHARSTPAPLREPGERAAKRPAKARIALRPGDHQARHRRRVPQARPSIAGPQPGHVHRRDRLGPHDAPVPPGPRLEHQRRRTCSPAWSRCSSGSPCCSPTSPRPWPRAGARPRPTTSARRGPRPSPTCASPTARSSRRPSSQLAVGDLCVVTAGEVIPGDGEIVEGIASVDESAITGESAPVIRESGGDRSAVTGGTRVLSDEIVVRITAKPGETFLDRMIALVEGANRQKTPNEIALNILLAGLTIIFLLATRDPAALRHLLRGRADGRSCWSPCSSASSPRRSAACCRPSASPAWTGSCSATCSPCRVGPSRPPATAPRCCSTRPARSRSATARPPCSTRRRASRSASWPRWRCCRSLADETPEGRSIVALAEADYAHRPPRLDGAELVPFTAQTRMSGVNLDGRPDPQGRGRLGAARGSQENGGAVPSTVFDTVDGDLPLGRHAARRGRRRRRASASSS